MNLVKFELMEKYLFRGYAKIMKQVVARTILNIPVNKDDPVNKISKKRKSKGKDDPVNKDYPMNKISKKRKSKGNDDPVNKVS
ncbi:unnamed protein product [Rhizophagus irregularis]|nr:unnamed protein product [Rhizophagus irregularis]